MARQLNDSRRAREAMMAEQNRWIENVNARVSIVLAAVTDQEPPQSPQQWWTWWNEKEGVYVEDKQWEIAYRREERRPDPISVTAPLALPTGPRSGGSGRSQECLAAGTPVWTDRGAVAIERIEVGDQVLSKHPETGRLAYKPVLRTTVRPAGRLVKMRLDGEVIESSDGHPFWISGQGWVLAKQTKAGMRLHGVRGSSHVQSVQPGGFAKTYNLIVADFHTYFAGNSKILSHDNTIRKPTDNVVPGLAAK